MRVFLLLLIFAATGRADDWPQWLGPKRDAVWRETGILKRFPKDGLKVRWRAPVGPGYSGPAVANGRVVVTDRKLAKGATNPANPFVRGSIPGWERVLCFDQQTGQLLWKHDYKSDYTISYAKGPRATPVIDDRRVYTLGAEGQLFCRDLKTGNVIWSTHFAKAFGAKTPTWGFASNPLVDRNRLICLVGGEGSAVVAFDKRTGRELWRALTTKDVAYCPPVIYRAGGTRQLIVWLIDGVHGLNPETGETYWSHPWKIRGGGAIAMPRRMRRKLFFSSFFNGSLMLRFEANPPDVGILWQSPKITTKNTVFLHALNTTPWLEDGHIYGVCNYGQFRCLQAQDGKRLWETLQPLRLKKPRRNATAFIVKHEDRFFIANDSGELIIAKLSSEGYEELDSTPLIEPTDEDAARPIVWSHPAFANRHVYARNDEEIICASLELPATHKGKSR